MTVVYCRIRDQVADEIAIQDALGNQLGERWLPTTPTELLTADEHSQMRLPRLEVQNFDHSIVVTTPEGLAHVFDAAAELAGGRYTGKDATIEHETQHAEAAERLGQNGVRYLARLTVGAPFTLPDGRQVRNIGITAYTLLESVRTSRLGVGLFLGFPEDTNDASEDLKRIQTLGYKDADQVIKRAASFNARTRSDTYPLPRRAA